MRKARLLLIEDETDILALNTNHFLGQGYDVFSADTLALAYALVCDAQPDLILLDVVLPDGSGFDFCQKIRPITTVPIIYLTSKSAQEDLINGLTIGGDDYLTKPYSLDVLSAKVASALRRNGFINTGRIEKPPLVIDHVTGQVTLSGVDLALSKKEMQLLSLLASNAGREFDAEEISHIIWGDGGSPGTLRSHISSLRKKIASGNDYFEIVLTPGKGYMFLQTGYQH